MKRLQLEDRLPVSSMSERFRKGLMEVTWLLTSVYNPLVISRGVAPNNSRFGKVYEDTLPVYVSPSSRRRSYHRKTSC